MTELNETCPIWGTPAKVWQWDYGGRQVDSPRAGGRYKVNGGTIGSLRALDPGAKARLTTWIYETNLSDSAEANVMAEDIDRAIARRALTLDQKFDRFFRLLRRKNFGHADHLRIAGIVDDETRRWQLDLNLALESAEDKETSAVLNLLKDVGCTQEDSHYRIKLTTVGFRKLEGLDAIGAESRQGFVAMWFGSEMNEPFKNGFDPAIRDAGYDPQRIDQKQHLNKIDDEIIAEIRRSRFVVADFTSEIVDHLKKPTAIARGGVYYEAGFAQGLGIPVIWTVRADCVDHMHFDTRQYSHLVWNDSAELKTLLQNRIVALFGQGPIPAN